MKKIIFIFIFFFLCTIIGTYVGLFYHPTQSPLSKSVKGVSQIQLPSSIITPTRSSLSELPKQLTIPKIHVNAVIESVGLDQVGRMDVPKKSQDVGWYEYGYRPGERGSAVIDGHLDTVTGAPAVFWDIAKLQKGDTVTVTTDHNTNYTFTVTDKASYPYNQVPLQQIFISKDKPRLNLITCQGTWDKKTKNYSNREVIYAEML